MVLFCFVFFCTGETAFASVVWRHQDTKGILFWDIEMIKMLRMSSEVLSACDTGNCCL